MAVINVDQRWAHRGDDEGGIGCREIFAFSKFWEGARLAHYIQFFIGKVLIMFRL